MSAVAGPSRPPPRVDGTGQAARESQLYNSIARLSVHDIEGMQELQGSGLARDPGRPLSDAELALQLATEEARAFNIFNQDRALALGMQQETTSAVAGRSVPV